MCACGCLRCLSFSILSIETGCLNPELIIPGSLASHLVHWISHLHVSGTGLQVGVTPIWFYTALGSLTLLTCALPLSRLLSPDLNTEIHFSVFLLPGSPISLSQMKYLIAVCLRAQLSSSEQLYPTRYEIDFEKWVLYRMKRNSTLFDKIVWSCYSCFIHSKEFFS